MVVESLSCVQLFATPWTAAFQASLSFTISQSLLKLRSVDAIQPSHSLSSPSPPALSLSQHQGLESALHIRWRIGTEPWNLFQDRILLSLPSFLKWSTPNTPSHLTLLILKLTFLTSYSFSFGYPGIISNLSWQSSTLNSSHCKCACLFHLHVRGTEVPSSNLLISPPSPRVKISCWFFNNTSHSYFNFLFYIEV